MNVSPEQPILTVEDLSIQFGGLKAVDHLSFSIGPHEIFGLIGPNGAGKTTVFNCITQFYKADHGKIEFINSSGQSVDLTHLKVHQIIHQGLVRTFQNVELIRELSLIDNVLIGAHTTFRTSLLAQAFATRKARREEKQLRMKAQAILDSFEIGHLALQPAGGQPYGVLKKVEFARALIGDPKMIILDEPAAGLNDVETLQLAKTIRQIRYERNCAILLVEHDMRLVMDVCDRICAISFGKHLATGTPDEIQKNTDVQAAYLGVEVQDA